MKREQIIDLLREHQAQLNQFEVRSLALFGSAARDELRPDSDVDVLVEFDGPVSFDRYMDTKFYLEDVLGRSVDLVTRRAVKPRVWPYIERELIHVA